MLCAAGSARLQLDFLLSRNAHAANLQFHVYANAMLFPDSFLQASVKASLHMVYYCWLEERQLARGAKYLVQVSHQNNSITLIIIIIIRRIIIIMIKMCL